jgi:predicted amidohydrolase YtcJ/type 1 glutamine amidotransferase
MVESLLYASQAGPRPRLRGLALMLLTLTALGAPPDSDLPKVLFFANPMRSDNDVIRRLEPGVLSVAERHFAELSRGVFDARITQDGGEVTREKLDGFQAVVFFTAIDPPGVDKDGLVEWVQKGGAFVGIHSTANTYQNHPPFGEMLGARYDRRPWRTPANPQTKVRIKVADRTHPATRHLGESFEIADDIYLFKDFDPGKVRLLLSLDVRSLDLTRPGVNLEDRHLPVSWTRAHGEGRVFYTALGDWEETWRNPLFRTHLIQGIRWALGSDADADLILYGGKVATVDDQFSMCEAVAVQGGRIVHLGSSGEILAHRGPLTEVIDLKGKLVLPGLIDSHTHPVGACLTEFDHPIPTMETIRDVLDYIGHRSRLLPEGDWIVLQQVFITRLEEQRYPTRAELDQVAPNHPVMFRTGPDVSLNTLALKISGIGRDFEVTDGSGGFAEKDPQTGELTGILRNCRRYVKVQAAERQPTADEKLDRLQTLFADYNAVGLTSVCDRDAGPAQLEVYRQLRARDGLTVRVSVSQHIDSTGPLDRIQSEIRKVSEDPLFQERDDWLRIIGIKTYLDGGMLTGSAYLRQPWGVSRIYGITDPDYRGVLFIPPERLVEMVRTTVQCGLQFTAHAVGDGAVQTLLDAYAAVDQEDPVRRIRPCISHSNFMSREAVEQAARLGVMVDIQPAWLWLDTRTLARQFGYERLRWFQPLRSLFEAGAVAGGGSDHMQKVGSLRSVNPYNPFLGMATAITRRANRFPDPLHPEEALTREQAIRFYTINNARILGCDDRLGSLEPGKLADLIVLDTDLLTCPEEDIEPAQVLRTYVGGKLVHRRDGNP